MNLTNLSIGLGSIGPFSTRVFLPAFLTALLLRFGGHIPVLCHLGMLAEAQHAPPNWFTSDAALWILGTLSVVEIFAHKSATLRTLLHEFDLYLKPALALLTSFGVLRTTDAQFVQQNFSHAGAFDIVIPLLSAVGTFHVARRRRNVATALYNLVEGTPLASVISWLEDAWAAFGIFLIALFPIFVLVMIALMTGMLLLVRRQIRAGEEQSKVLCAACGASIYSCAAVCPSCKQAVAQPAAVGILGFAKPYPTGDAAGHPFRLVEKRRCAACAAHRSARRWAEPCASCGNAAISDPQFALAYMEFVRRRLPMVLSVCLIMGMVPVIGLIVGTIYFQIELVLPFVPYLSLGHRFWRRLGLGILFVVMIFLQAVPIVGGLVLPIMAYVSYATYRNAFRDVMFASPSQESHRSIPTTASPSA
jgi:hypothetical protein